MFGKSFYWYFTCDPTCAPKPERRCKPWRRITLFILSFSFFANVCIANPEVDSDLSESEIKEKQLKKSFWKRNKKKLIIGGAAAAGIATGAYLYCNSGDEGENKLDVDSSFEKLISNFFECFKSDAFFRNQENWLNLNDTKKFEKLFDLLNKQENIYPHIQKLILEPGSKICFMGDIHGSYASLKRNINKLIDKQFLNSDLKITKAKFNMIFLGDYANFAKGGVEVWNTLLRLKLKNWDNVFLMRGNHEERGLSSDVFRKELKEKFGSKGEAIFDEMCHLYEFLPLAIYVGCNDNFIQCCHGGIEPSYDFNALRNSNKIFEKIDKPNGFNWSIFNGNIGNKIVKSWSAYDATIEYAKDYLAKNGLNAFFRGHQHSYYGLKLFELGTTKPLDWKNVVKGKTNSFLIKDYEPIFTFSTAQSVGVDCDCFGILNLEKKYEDWSLDVYETKFS